MAFVVGAEPATPRLDSRGVAAARLQIPAHMLARGLEANLATVVAEHRLDVRDGDGTLLDSTARPTYFQRSFSGSGYDYEALGWPWTELDHGHAEEPNADRRRMIYDTTLPGYSNAGHRFGDVLTEEDREAVIEYLKTL